MVKQTFLMPCFKMTKEFSHLQATTLQMFILSQWVENAFFRNQSGNTRRGLIIRRSTHTGLKMAEPRGRGCQKKYLHRSAVEEKKPKAFREKGRNRSLFTGGPSLVDLTAFSPVVPTMTWAL